MFPSFPFWDPVPPIAKVAFPDAGASTSTERRWVRAWGVTVFVSCTFGIQTALVATATALIQYETVPPHTAPFYFRYRGVFGHFF